MQLPKPFIPGCDLAGTVEAIGPGAKRFKKGARVWGSNQGLLGRQGTLAEYAVVQEEWLYPTPAGVPDAEAAAKHAHGWDHYLARLEIAARGDDPGRDTWLDQMQ